MRKKEKSLCFVLAVALSLLDGCASVATREGSPPGQGIPADTLMKMEQEAARIQKADEDRFNLLSIKVDEYHDTLALCESLPKDDGDSRIGTICRERLKKLREDIDSLSSLLHGQPSSP